MELCPECLGISRIQCFSEIATNTPEFLSTKVCIRLYCVSMATADTLGVFISLSVLHSMCFYVCTNSACLLGCVTSRGEDFDCSSKHEHFNFNYTYECSFPGCPALC